MAGDLSVRKAFSLRSSVPPWSVLAVAAALFAAGCGSSLPTISIGEARRIAGDFKVANFKPPARTIADLRRNFGDGAPIPDSCDSVRARRRDGIREAAAGLRHAGNDRMRYAGATIMLDVAENAMNVGKFDEAIGFIKDALGVFRSDELRWSPRRAMLYALLSRVYARTGDIFAARVALLNADKHWADYAPWMRNIEEFQKNLSTNAATAVLAHARGQLPVAEYYYRRVLAVGYRASTFYMDLNVDFMTAELVRVLLEQRRLVEAEAEAREAIRLRGINNPLDGTYNEKAAESVAMLAAVFLAQRRLDDAAYLAGIAVNMHQRSCVEPAALGLARARKILIAALAQQQHWPAVLREIAAARQALAAYPEVFERQFGTGLDAAEAETYAGDAARGLDILRRALDGAAAEHGADSYPVAEIRGLLGLAQLTRGSPETAHDMFAAALPALLRGAAGGAGARPQVDGGSAARRQRILAGYMALLQASLQKGDAQANRAVAQELLRIATADRLGRVQQALSASWTRAGAGDPELALLVRQEQDMAEESRSVAETLAYLQGGLIDAGLMASLDGLKSRLADLNRARDAVRSEILTRFPKFRQLTAPQPPPAEEIRAALKADQALIVFHVMDERSYVWAFGPGGSFGFSTIKQGRQALELAVRELRKAVDPERATTLADIPAFDVRAAHALYAALLAPVEAGWKAAKNLLVVADGALAQLPLSLLVTAPLALGADRGLLFEGYRRVPWLANTHSITLLPSVASLKSLGGGPAVAVAGRRPFAGFGDPYFSTLQQAQAQDQLAKPARLAARGISLRSAPQTRAVDSAEIGRLPRLADTRDEIIAVATALKANPAQDVFLGERASESRVKSMDLTPYRVISFATHGLVPGDLNGLDQPALALSSPKVTRGKEDGLLTMNEILGLRLNADFAVLSACNTAAAEGAGAEAVSGLGRAFFYAGVRALLVSNWPVHSGATTHLMTRLFETLAADASLSRAEALRRTRAAMIIDGTFKVDGKDAFSYAHPIFWAPFTIIGDGGGKAAIN